MNKILLAALVASLVGCKSVNSLPSLTEREQDKLVTPTKTVLPNETTADVPKGTWVRTDSDEKTEVVLEEDTVAVLVDENFIPMKVESPDPKAKSPVLQQRVLLPKNTQVMLPENTFLQTTDPAKMRIQPSSEVVLPSGTEISITKINWYAILFYTLLIFWGAWHYMQLRKEDKDGDGLVDEPVEKKEEKSNP
jgi:hypothetical protein